MACPPGMLFLSKAKCCNLAHSVITSRFPPSLVTYYNAVLKEILMKIYYRIFVHYDLLFRDSSELTNWEGEGFI